MQRQPQKEIFTATREPPTEESDPLEERDGDLEITPFPNRPLGIAGPVEICSSSDRTLDRTTKTMLRRGGHSKGKLHCDGSHGTVGLTTGLPRI